MEGLGWIAAIVVGGMAGWVASMIMKAETGLLLNIVLGIVGALVANFLAGLVGVDFDAGSWLSQGVAGLIGACILIFGWRAIKR